jgi:hypothetical protein
MRRSILLSVLVPLGALSACDALLDIHDPAGLLEDGGVDSSLGSDAVAPTDARGDSDAGAPPVDSSLDGDAEAAVDSSPDSDAGAIDAPGDSDAGPSTDAASGLWAPGPAAGAQVRLADVTGDGRADFITIDSSGTVRVAVSNGERFVDDQAWTSPLLPPPCQNEPGCTRTTKTLDFADVDGDHRSDAVLVSPSGTFVSLSTGTNFGTAAKWSTESGSSLPPDQLDPTRSLTQLADMNADGKADIVEINDVLYVALSTGKSFASATPWTPKEWKGDYAAAFVDMTGDGKADCVSACYGGMDNSAQIFVLPSTGLACDTGDHDDSGVWNNYYPWNTTLLYPGKGTVTADGNGFLTADGSGDGLADVYSVRIGNAPQNDPPLRTTITALDSNRTGLVPTGAIAPTWFDTSRTFTAMAIADVDGDPKRKADLIAVDNDGVRVFLSDGTKFVAP